MRRSSFRRRISCTGWWMMSWMDGRQVHSILEILAALPVPVTLVHGREDAVLPWQQALNVPGSVAIHLLPDVGHMPHWEAAALVSTIIGRAAGRG